MRQFSRISDGRVNVFRLKRRIALEDLLLAGPFGKTVEDVRDEDARPFGAELAVTNQRVAAEVLSPVNHGLAPFLHGSLSAAWPLLDYNLHDLPRYSYHAWLFAVYENPKSTGRTLKTF